MPVMDLHVNIKGTTEQTTFDIHNFNPEVRASDDSLVGPQYNYVVLAHGRYDAPTQVRVFMNRDEVLALHEKLKPIVEKYRAQMAPAIIEDPPEAFLGGPEVPCAQPASV